MPAGPFRHQKSTTCDTRRQVGISGKFRFRQIDREGTARKCVRRGVPRSAVAVAPNSWRMACACLPSLTAGCGAAGAAGVATGMTGPRRTRSPACGSLAGRPVAPSTRDFPIGRGPCSSWIEGNCVRPRTNAHISEASNTRENKAMHAKGVMTPSLSPALGNRFAYI